MMRSYHIKAIFRSVSVILLSVLSFSCEKKQPETIVAEAPQENTATATPTVAAGSASTVQPAHTPTLGLEIGDVAWDLNLQDSSGAFIKLSDLKGRVILLDFWASWCSPCKRENKNLMNVYRNYRDTLFKNCKGFEIYMVSVFERQKAHWLRELRTQKYNWRYNVYDEGGGATWRYNVKSVPKNFLIDHNGIIIAKDLRDSLVEQALIGLLK